MSPTAKLDDIELRSRLRSAFSAPTYTPRKIVRPEPQLFADITDWVNYGQARTKKPEPIQPVPEYLAVDTADSFGVNAETRQKDINVLAANSDQSQPLSTTTQSKTKIRFGKRFGLRIAFTLITVLLLSGGGYITYSGWRADNLVNLQARLLTAQANSKVSYKATSSKNGGSSTTATSSSVLITKKPSIDYYDSFTVPPDNPRYIKIPKLDVNTIVTSVGVTSSGALATPDNVYNTAWYNASAKPGQPGATLIDGHVSSWTTHGVFYGIKTLKAGDAIQIVKGDGSLVNYKVVSSQVYTSGDVDMQAAVTPVVSGQSGLNLITCTGDVIPGTSEFNERIIVFATED